MKNQTRWQLAQNYELNWWKDYNEGLEGYYRTCSQEIGDFVKPFLDINQETRILEIGSGPAGALTFLKSNNKYAIDPLEDFFSSKEEWIRLRDPEVKYQKGKGEDLPYDEEFFDLIILDNVLDHCENPALVLDEVNRVLKRGGIIFLRLNLYNWWGSQIRRIMELAAIDKAHPFTFRKRQLLDHFMRRSWEIKMHRDYGHLSTWIDDLSTLTVKGLVKSILSIARSRTLFILEKR